MLIIQKHPARQAPQNRLEGKHPSYQEQTAKPQAKQFGWNVPTCAHQSWLWYEKSRHIRATLTSKDEDHLNEGQTNTVKIIFAGSNVTNWLRTMWRSTTVRVCHAWVIKDGCDMISRGTTNHNQFDAQERATLRLSQYSSQSPQTPILQDVQHYIGTGHGHKAT